MHFYLPYAAIRFGTPDDVPNPLYERSLVYHLQRLKYKILLLHSTQNFNVRIDFSEVLVRVMMKKGKVFEYLAYSDEGHVWNQPEKIRDVCLRSNGFLIRYL